MLETGCFGEFDIICYIFYAKFATSYTRDNISPEPQQIIAINNYRAK